MGKVFAVSDLHGQGQLWNRIKEFLAPDDTLYFLGDAIDRGPEGYRIMNELLEDPRVIYIKGNHEFMMEEALQENRRYGYDEEFFFGEKTELWEWNGAYPTFTAWREDGSPYKYIKIFREMPVEQTYVNKNNITILMSHAGYNPTKKPTEDFDLIWSRKHITEYCDTPEDCNSIIVHGHTPTSVLKKRLNKCKRTVLSGSHPERASYYDFTQKNEVVFYGNRKNKIDIDCGSYVSGITALLDLDTLETHRFFYPVE